MLPRRQLPNAITVVRLGIAAAFFASLNAYRYPDHNQLFGNLAIALFILAAASDALDGYLARRWQAMSIFGRIMDPFCDKVLVIGAFIYLAGPRFVVPAWVEADDFFTMATAVYPWMVVLILVRELLVTGVRGVLESMGVQFGSKLMGKAKMILQSICIPIVLALTVNFTPSENPWAMWTCHVLVYTMLIATIWSGLPYVAGLRHIFGAGTEGPAAAGRRRDEGTE